jgi:hypothetical protein
MKLVRRKFGVNSFGKDDPSHVIGKCPIHLLGNRCCFTDELGAVCVIKQNIAATKTPNVSSGIHILHNIEVNFSGSVDIHRSQVRNASSFSVMLSTRETRLYIVGKITNVASLPTLRQFIQLQRVMQTCL